MSGASATPLEGILRAEIAERGPISLARYMDLCLAHPEHGYYRRQNPIGAAGDFTTAPEISQIFGELIGLWLAQVWRDQGAPSPAALVELGPGRGALMADALRVIARVAPDFYGAAQLFLVETSPVLRQAQAAALEPHQPRWLDAIEDAPDGPIYLIANEFFDALPIRRFAVLDGAWREQQVTIAQDRLAFAFGDPLDLAAEAGAEAAAVAARHDLGSVETCPGGAAIAGTIAERIGRHGGAALIVDYGYGAAAFAQSAGADTLQALRDHRPADPLASPGLADLTAHVDFSALAAAAAPFAAAYGPLAQGSLLRRLGAEARAAALAAKTPAKADSVAAGLHRLTHPKEMGSLFKALALTPKGAPPPPAFED